MPIMVFKKIIFQPNNTYRQDFLQITGFAEATSVQSGVLNKEKVLQFKDNCNFTIDDFENNLTFEIILIFDKNVKNDLEKLDLQNLEVMDIEQYVLFRGHLAVHEILPFIQRSLEIQNFGIRMVRQNSPFFVKYNTQEFLLNRANLVNDEHFLLAQVSFQPFSMQ